MPVNAVVDRLAQQMPSRGADEKGPCEGPCDADAADSSEPGAASRDNAGCWAGLCLQPISSCRVYSRCCHPNPFLEAQWIP
jgi:hypothetical protein